MITCGDKWTKTGLEDLVQEFGVKVNEDRVFDVAKQRNPASLTVRDESDNPDADRPCVLESGPLRSYLFNLRRRANSGSRSRRAGASSRFTVSPLVYARLSEQRLGGEGPAAIDPVVKAERIQCRSSLSGENDRQECRERGGHGH